MCLIVAIAILSRSRDKCQDKPELFESNTCWIDIEVQVYLPVLPQRTQSYWRSSLNVLQRQNIFIPACSTENCIIGGPPQHALTIMHWPLLPFVNYCYKVWSPKKSCQGQVETTVPMLLCQDMHIQASMYVWQLPMCRLEISSQFVPWSSAWIVSQFVAFWWLKTSFCLRWLHITIIPGMTTHSLLGGLKHFWVLGGLLLWRYSGRSWQIGQSQFSRCLPRQLAEIGAWQKTLSLLVVAPPASMACLWVQREKRHWLLPSVRSPLAGLNSFYRV